jgi:hypothetical protein
MRWASFFFCLFFLPLAAHATDTHINVSFTLSQDRVTPPPIAVHPHVSVHLVLHENGTVDDAAHMLGNDFSSTGRLGGGRFRVVNEHTITRSWSLGSQQRKLTITTQGRNCTAELAISGSDEFSAYAPYLKKDAVFRNAHVDSISCEIQ